jgi:hypothetical protein
VNKPTVAYHADWGSKPSKRWCDEATLGNGEATIQEAQLDELSLDRCFWREVSTSLEFRRWLLGKTKFADRNLELVTDELWHQRWYRDPVTMKESEGDILLLFRDVIGSERYALHIENKPAHRKWEPNQAENYRRRATHKMKAWDYVDFQTVLLAPSVFVNRHAVEAAHFDFVLLYEDVGPFVPEFADELKASSY